MAVTAASLGMLAGAGPVSAGTQTVTFGSTGAAKTWQVPEGTTSATFTVAGAQGGGESPGAGVRLSSTMAVSPGDVLQINVGGQPGTGSNPTTQAGGFNGGGDANSDGAGGGGSSDIRRAPYTLDNRYIVAAGGGGTGYDLYDGGSGGTAQGMAGRGTFNGGEGGGGGSQVCCAVGGSGGEPGADGSLGLGGSAGGEGGGGGGGLYGGGGGGGFYDGFFPSGTLKGGGGGGGSSLVMGDGTVETGSWHGDGQVSISYTPATTAVSLSATSLNFGSQKAGTTSGVQSVTVTNTGSAPLTIDAATTSGDFGAAPTSTCVAGASFAPDSWCTVDVTFAPTGPGALTGTLSLASNAQDSPHTVALGGTGTVPAVEVTPSWIDFGVQKVGSTGGPQTVTVTNTGDATLLFNGATTSGDFLVGPEGTCFAGTGVDPGGFCTVDVLFAPTTQDSHNGEVLSISHDAPGGVSTVSLQGWGEVPEATLMPNSLTFGDQLVGSTSGSQTVEVFNSSPVPLQIHGVATTGDFTVTGATCGGDAPLAPETSCTVGVAFRPTAAGARTGTLDIADDAPGSPHTAALTGNGRQPAADLGLSLGATPNPVKSGGKLTYTITVANAGPDAAGNPAVADALPANTQFMRATHPGWSCTLPAVGSTGTVKCSRATLASGSTATIQVVVKVVAPGRTTITNKASVTSTTADPDVTDNSATVATSTFGRK